ncbi:hypothetical protein GCG54_00000446 [Colletotrichum gloeosporioides]|uniref:IBR domain-containing protein n=1 Tax=Colletotrichum gloeosporioides TaxID=474922 RepID=A0A8H4CUI8_COLGL|nr:uncharacterized protein GCG54_00000446 [Colletotrichum gloeosporioides]KAF3810400.1 hypothetical protein GCG54_00000446 [Colletotrichum gloeosporioides]
MSSTTMIANRTSIVPANSSVVRHKLGVDMTITAGGEVTGFELTDATHKTLIWTGCASTVKISWLKDGARDVAYQYRKLLSYLETFAKVSHFTRPEEYDLRCTTKITLENSDQAAMAVKNLAYQYKDLHCVQAFEARIGVPHDQMSTISHKFNELHVLALRDRVSTELERSETMATITVTGSNRLAVTNIKRQLAELIEQTAILDTTTIRAPKIQSERTCMACFDVLKRPVLPSCGHQSVFCAECLLETYRANHKKGPLRCTEQNDNGELCHQPIDLECLANNLPPALFEDFLDLAANAFVARNPNLVRHCPTPGCRQVYQPTPKTEGSMGTPKTCPDCLVRLCTTCGHQHDNESPCDSMIDTDLEQAKKDLEARDCPGCSTPIVKYDGCDKVECPGCGTFICWACMETYPTAIAAYNHMVKDHGTVGEGYILHDENGNPILPDDERIENELAELQFPVDDEDPEPAQDDGRDRDQEWTEYDLAKQEYLDDNKYYLDKDQYEEYGKRLEPTQDNSRDRGEERMEVRANKQSQPQQPMPDDAANNYHYNNYDSDGKQLIPDDVTGRPAAALESYPGNASSSLSHPSSL